MWVVLLPVRQRSAQALRAPVPAPAAPAAYDGRVDAEKRPSLRAAEAHRWWRAQPRGKSPPVLQETLYQAAHRTADVLAQARAATVGRDRSLGAMLRCAPAPAPRRWRLALVESAVP
eukprot:scaffold2910_cov390-Prasinococcus_capsulatus_cf.AAC.67